MTTCTRECVLTVAETDAKRSVLVDSSACTPAGLTQQIMAVRAVDSEGSKMRVSLLLRYGTCDSAAAAAAARRDVTPAAASPSAASLVMHCDSAKRLLLIEPVSANVAPTAPLFATRSEPARSTKLSTLMRMPSSSAALPPFAPLPPLPPLARLPPPGAPRTGCSMVTRKSACERLESSLARVAALARRALPVPTSERACLTLVSVTSCSPSTTTPRSASSRIDGCAACACAAAKALGARGASRSRSRISSL